MEQSFFLLNNREWPGVDGIKFHRLHGWMRSFVEPVSDVSYFGFVSSSKAGLHRYSNQCASDLTGGMFFALSEAFAINGASGFIIEIEGHKCMPMIGGPIEKEGRLKYIDGCTDSLLIPPVKMGDPCLNHLHFPAKINQTMHTHPSLRLGMIVGGSGVCETPWGKYPLEPGMYFLIAKDGPHKFVTVDSHMDVIAFHPDSDFGPRDEDHPMINRTIVEGVSASKLPHIQTK